MNSQRMVHPHGWYAGDCILYLVLKTRKVRMGGRRSAANSAGDSARVAVAFIEYASEQEATKVLIFFALVHLFSSFV